MQVRVTMAQFRMLMVNLECPSGCEGRRGSWQMRGEGIGGLKAAVVTVTPDS
jgi:hypothetical protein